jgi:2,3-dihydroxybenzoate decarboxylase
MSKPRIIAIEEHYQDPVLAAHFTGRDTGKPKPLEDRLMDIADVRIKEMDEAGIDIQVLSHQAPSAQKLSADIAATVTKKVNDNLFKAVQSNPDRLAGFAALPTADPKAAADELERCVTKLNFKGAMLSGLTDGRFLDEDDFWPIYERAAALDVPIYIHPSFPDERVVDAYYKYHIEKFPWILSAGWGFTVEAATQGVRMVLSGVCEKYPDLKFIMGHLGEGLPFLLGRVDESFSRPGNAPLSFRDVFCNNFYVTTSGFFSDPALICTAMELGTDRIMFAIDWPYVNNKVGVDWLDGVPTLSAEDKAKIFSGNAERLLKM